MSDGGLNGVSAEDGPRTGAARDEPPKTSRPRRVARDDPAPLAEKVGLCRLPQFAKGGREFGRFVVGIEPTGAGKHPYP